MPDFFPLLIPLFIGLVVVLIVVGIIQAIKRRKELRQWAAAHGLTFTRAKDRGYDDRYPDFQALHKGSNRYAHNIISGRWNDRPVRCFDYHYETYSTDSKGRRKTNHHHFSAVILEHGHPFRSLLIRPEGFFDKVTEFFGYDDIDFELDEFSRSFYVKCDDKRFAFDVIHQATMEFMLAQERFTMDWEGPRVMIYRGRRMKPGDYEDAIALAEGMLERLPDYLLQEFASRQGETAWNHG